MRKIYLLCISIMLTMVACQKEAQLVNNTNNTNQVAKAPTMGGKSVLLNTNSTTVNSLGSDAIGWFIDLSNYGVESESVKSGPLSSSASNLGGSAYCGGVKTATLFAGQNIPMGTLYYANDATNLYISYVTNADWFMTEVHLFVGTLASVPKSGGGTPTPGRFAINQSFTSTTLKQSLDYTFPLSSLQSGSLIIAAHASVIQIESDGDIVSKETAWSAGTRFTASKSWATYTPLTLGTCGGGGVGDIKANNSNKN